MNFNTFVVLLSAAVFTIIGSLGYQIYKDQKRTCLEKTTVVSIQEIKHRKVVFLLSNGNTVEVYQPSVKLGDEHCAKWSE